VPTPAAGTRQPAAAVLAASAALFARDGYDSVTLEAIAAHAGVTVPEVHAHGSKALLLVSAYEFAFSGEADMRALAERPGVVALMQLPPAEAIDGFSRYLAAGCARSVGVWQAMMTAASRDADVSAAREVVDQRRDHDFRVAITWADSHNLLRGDAKDEERIEILANIASLETYIYYVVERGWETARYARWLRRAMEHLVFDAWTTA
jgi:AcrR family transcriptional regulator